MAIEYYVNRLGRCFYMQPSVNMEGIHYYIKLVKALEEYIQEELEDSAFYLELSKLSPTENIKSVILEMAEAEKSHADSFQKAYLNLTGLSFTPRAIMPIEIDNYQMALNSIISDEIKDYKEYGKQFLLAPTPYLQDLFYMAKTLESQHITRLPFLMHETEAKLTGVSNPPKLKLVK